MGPKSVEPTAELSRIVPNGTSITSDNTRRWTVTIVRAIAFDSSRFTTVYDPSWDTIRGVVHKSKYDAEALSLEASNENEVHWGT